MLNLCALDKLVQQHIAFEEQVSECPTSDQAICVRCLRRASLLLEREGDVESALETARAVDPRVLDNEKLQFRLRRHQLLELLAKVAHLGAANVTVKRKFQTDALTLCREKLAPLALEAHPDAYSEFKDAMILFLSPERASGRLQREREAAARYLESELIQLLGPTDSTLGFALKYLALVHDQFYRHEASVSPCEALLGRLSINTATERVQGTGGGRRDFPALEVQALSEAVQMSRDDAIECLQHSGGDVHLALRNELGRIRIDRDTLDYFANEYADLRGLRATARNGAEAHPDCCHGPLGEKSLKEKIEILEFLRKQALDRNVERFIDCTVTHGIDLEPECLFGLWQTELVRLVQEGRTQDAVQVAQVCLGPLADENPDLLPSLKETMLILAFPGFRYADGSPINEDEFPVLREAEPKRLGMPLWRFLGLEDPALLKVMDVALDAHTSWFEKSRAIDIFAGELGIDPLVQKHDRSGSCPKAMSQSQEGDRLCGTEPSTVQSHDGAREQGLRNADEHAVLLLTEVMGMSRAEAIQILASMPGDSVDPAEVIDMLLRST